MGQQASQQPQENDPNPGVAWWCKLLARVCGVIAAIVAMVTGVTAAIGISVKCLIAGIIQIMLGLLVMIFESPCCCYWLDIAKPLADFADRRPFFHKALIYVIVAIFPVIICASPSTICGSGLVFATGVLYGLMALGKKADRTEMMARAQGQSVPPMTGDTTDDTKPIIP